MLIVITSHLSFEYHDIYYTNTLSNQIMGIYWPRTKALYHNKSSHTCHQWLSRFCKKAASNVRCTSTFDPTACYLVDYNQQQHQVLKSRVLGTQDAFTKYQISMHHQLYQHMKRKNNFLLNRIYMIMALSESKIIRLYINLLPCFLTLFDILHFLHNNMVVVIMASKEYFCEVRSCNQKCFCNLRKYCPLIMILYSNLFL